MERLLYEFASKWYRDGRSQRTTCQGRRSFIERFIRVREFAELLVGMFSPRILPATSFWVFGAGGHVSSSGAFCASAVPNSNSVERRCRYVSKFSQLRRQQSKSLQATAGRSDASIKIMKTHPLQSALASASGA